MEETVPSVEAYEAAMVLSGVGDALGYRGGRWEYCTSGPQIHAELAELGGLAAITLEPPEWPVSDDTVLHLATAEGLATGGGGSMAPHRYRSLGLGSPLYPRLAVECSGPGGGTSPAGAGSPLRGCHGRHGGTQAWTHQHPGYLTAAAWGARRLSHPLQPPRYRLRGRHAQPGHRPQYRYPHAWELPTLIRVSIESGRMTHHHPTVALFGALGARGEPPERWGAELLRVLPLAWDYVEGTGVAVEDNAAAWPFFGEAWHRYLDSRGLLEGRGPAQVPSLPSPAERDTVYLGWALEGWAGRSGHDAPMVALEALLAAGGCWEDLCGRAVLHGGDNDSTGTIAAGCWGLQGGLTSVPSGLHCHLEHRERLRNAAHQLHVLAWGRR
ncbi:ADP-ribosylhydrolase ARH1-like isoform X2 [Manacus candei]|uniref:ADP-ribosylhydrolase ARH1-like isoform X2 n=1 Tax=Manacus candei TaxID=415023 RepID=UPI00222725A3|nr:ADP-ribosylhydrolase ARH1-like isoform X2 [Manacus candei]